jgi:Glycine zipper 2TM domain
LQLNNELTSKDEMKKLILLGQMTALVVLFANVSYASGGGDRGRGHGGHHRHHGERYNQQGNYYGPPPQNYQDPRSHQGLAGGVVGSVLGYEMGNGHPLAAGLGAAAGSFIGNEVSGRR